MQSIQYTTWRADHYRACSVSTMYCTCSTNAECVNSLHAARTASGQQASCTLPILRFSVLWQLVALKTLPSDSVLIGPIGADWRPDADLYTSPYMGPCTRLFQHRYTCLCRYLNASLHLFAPLHTHTHTHTHAHVHAHVCARLYMIIHGNS